MNIKRRLDRLESRPFRRPIEQTDAAKNRALLFLKNWRLLAVKTEMDRAVQQQLGLPLPKGHTPEEATHALSLMKAAQKLPIDDQSGWQAVRDYALSLHRKYGTDPTWGDN